MPERPTLHLIVNPVASGVGPRAESDALAALRAFAAVEVRRTDGPGDAGRLAVEAADAGADAVVILAGDGTANEAINGAGDRLAYGFLPAGGTSVLPRALGLPRDLPGSARAIGLALRDGRTRRIALGSLNGRRFAFSAGIGFDADVVRRVDAAGRKRGRRPGDAYFGLQVARTLAGGRYAQPVLTVESADQPPVRGASVLTANTHPWSYVGALPLHLAPGARFEGGLEVAVPRDLRLRRVPQLMDLLLRTGAHATGGHPLVAYLHDQAVVRVICDEPLPAQVDGDDMGNVLEARFEAIPDALSVLVT